MPPELLTQLVGPPSLGVRASLADVVYGALRDAITGGTLRPGYHLREIPLSKHFGVSTTPVREALRRLDREGLVAVQPNRGAVVAAFDLPEVFDLYEAREVLETRAVRRAAETPGRDLSRLLEILDELESVIDVPDQIQFNQLDVHFHRGLNDLGGNRQLAELAERIHRQIQGVRVRCAIYLPGRPRVSHTEHRAIVEAVRAGDADRAEALSRGHILSVRDAVVGALRQAVRSRGRVA